VIDLLIKLLIVMFTVFVGGCFVLWPEEVARRFDKWRGGSVESAKGRWSDVRKYAVVTWLRQIAGSSSFWPATFFISNGWLNREVLDHEQF
jgi:hypothetical protein